MTNGLFAHKTFPTKFALYVDNFGIQYNSEQDLQHLITKLQNYYDILIKKNGKITADYPLNNTVAKDLLISA